MWKLLIKGGFLLKDNIITYLKRNGLYNSLWVFPSGGKIPDSISINDVSPIVKNRQIELRKSLGLEPRYNLTWADFAMLLPEFQSLRVKNLRWISKPEQTISIKLGPTYPNSNEYLFSIDLDCNKSWLDSEPFEEELRQEFFNKVIDALFKHYGKTLVTGSRGNGRHIIYKTNIPQTTKISNSVNNLMGFYWNDDPYYNFSVDYKTSDSWINNHHTTIYGEFKTGGYFGFIHEHPIRYVPNLQTNHIISYLMYTKLIKHSKEMQLKRVNNKRIKTMNTRIGGDCIV